MGTSDQEHLSMMVNQAVEQQEREYRMSTSKMLLWHCPELSKTDFWRLLSSTAQAIMAKRGLSRRFIVDDNNREVIRQMWLYVRGDKECEWDVNKGIYLVGKVGCGKTLLMQSLCQILYLISGFNIEMIPANVLHKRILHDGIDSLAKRPLFIDELGREQLEVNEFGTKIRPINDLMALRYNTGARTFFTSNFKISTLSQGFNNKGEMMGYGKYIGERIQEVANFVMLPGESRREKWEEHNG